MIDEADRSLHDALSVLSQTVKETRVVLGGGCSEMLMSVAVEEKAKTVKGKKAIAAEAFARALRQIPTILADNAGFDSSDLVAQLRAAHYEGKADSGLNMDEGSIASMKTLGVTESYKLKRQVVLSASEAAEMILRYALSLFLLASVRSSSSSSALMISCGRLLGDVKEHRREVLS